MKSPVDTINVPSRAYPKGVASQTQQGDEIPAHQDSHSPTRNKIPRSKEDQVAKKYVDSSAKSQAPRESRTVPATSSVGMMPSLAFSIADSMLHKVDFRSGNLPKPLCVKLLQFAADRGHLDAMSKFGTLLGRYGASRIDKRKGFEYVREAAKKNLPEAQYQLACFYQDGIDCVQPDVEQCVHWITLAASAGHEGAATRLAKAYDNGELGLSVNHHRAQETRAAIQALEKV